MPAHSEHSRLYRRHRGRLSDARSSSNAHGDFSPIPNALPGSHANGAAGSHLCAAANSHVNGNPLANGGPDAGAHSCADCYANGGSRPDSDSARYSNGYSCPNPNAGPHGYAYAAQLHPHQQRGLAHLRPPRRRLPGVLGRR